jgi:hypothetical protein
LLVLFRVPRQGTPRRGLALIPGSAPTRIWPRRVGWLTVLWACGVAALGALALVVRLLMATAGYSC